MREGRSHFELGFKSLGLRQTGYLFIMGRYGDIYTDKRINPAPTVDANGSRSTNQPGFCVCPELGATHVRQCCIQQVSSIVVEDFG